MNKELKVSFYLKRESRLEKSSAGENVAYPIIGKIIIGNSIAQFSTKAESRRTSVARQIGTCNRQESHYR